jgi:hypothetical protein
VRAGKQPGPPTLRGWIASIDVGCALTLRRLYVVFVFEVGVRYALQVNAHRSNRETVDILTALLSTALRPDPTYRLPIPSLLVHGAHDHIGDIGDEHPRMGPT